MTIDYVLKNSNIPWIKDRTIYLCNSGSTAYGTSTPESDEDYRGIAIPQKEYFLSPFKKFEQLEIKEPDVVVFNLVKFIDLAAQNNPMMLEILYTDETDHIYINPIGEELLANKDLFLSKLCKERFLGYARAQLHRMKTHRKFILNPILSRPERKDFGLTEKPILPKNQLEAIQSQIKKQIDSWNIDFEPFSETQKIWLNRKIPEVLSEMKITSDTHWQSAARMFGISENFIEILSKERQYEAAMKDWYQFNEWKLNRNPKRYALEEKLHYDSKNAQNLYRLCVSALEVANQHKVIVKRPDAEIIKAIRNGAWTYEQLIEFMDKKEIEIKLAFEKSSLQDKPNNEKIENLCISLIEKSLIK